MISKMAAILRIIFIVVVTALFFFVLYASYRSNSRELFVKEQSLLDIKKDNGMLIYQGFSIPEKYKPTKIDVSNPANPSVDGDPNSLRSMYMFSFNRCAPECCLQSPYSCDRGCVCITPRQYQHLDKRGNNREENVCDFQQKI